MVPVAVPMVLIARDQAVVVRQQKGKSSDPAGASRSSIGGGNDDSVAEAAPASPDSPREWTPTRTGHLAVGAREVRRTPVRYAVYPWIATAIQG